MNDILNNMSKYIDHTVLKPDTKCKDIDVLCDEARQFAFKAVCVNPVFVKRCKENLKNSSVLIASVVGFPLGANLTETKVFETQNVLSAGADEIDMVINIGDLKSAEHDRVKNDIKAVVSAAAGKTVKVIIETCLLNDEEKQIACRLSMEAGAHFVKTSTGFSSGGATPEDIELMKGIVGDKMEVKASGGIRDLTTALSMIKKGATRIGTSSGVKIMEEIGVINE